MKRILLAVTGVLATVAMAACGNATSASATTPSGSASASPSGGANARRGGTAGELVRITGSTLLLNTQSGDVNVTVGGTTPVTKTRTGTLVDIVAGSCIIATGQKDAAGALTASGVRLSPKTNGTCTGGFGGPGGPGGAPDASASPRPSRTPQPGVTPPAVARGEVTSVAGTAVTLQDQTGAPVTITVPTTVQVAVSQVITSSQLAVGDCVLATGPKDSKGVVTARSVNVVPPGPSGCFTGGGGGFPGGGRGFGGGGFGGGGGGGGGAGA